MSIKIIEAILIIVIIMMIFSVGGIMYYKVMCKINELYNYKLKLLECMDKTLDLLEQNNERIKRIHEDIEEAYKRINWNKERIEVLEKDYYKKEIEKIDFESKNEEEVKALLNTASNKLNNMLESKGFLTAEEVEYALWDLLCIK